MRLGYYLSVIILIILILNQIKINRLKQFFQEMKLSNKIMDSKTLMDRNQAFWHSVRATPVLIPFAGVVMMLLSPSVMAGGFTIGAVTCSPLNALLKMLFRWIHFQLNGTYTGTTFLGQGLRPAGAKGTGVFLTCPPNKATTWGMPSGHSQIAWYTFGFLIGYLFIWRPHQFTTAHKITATILVLIMALVVSFSRVCVDGVHTLGQVIVGGIIGFTLGLVTLLITRVVAQKYWHEQFTNEIDMMAANEKAAEMAQAAAKEAESARLAAEAAKSAAASTNGGKADKEPMLDMKTLKNMAFSKPESQTDMKMQPNMAFSKHQTDKQNKQPSIGYLNANKQSLQQKTKKKQY
jgi:membrane-associated phospholipid phosphatase